MSESKGGGGVRIEEEIYANYTADEGKLRAYGFAPRDGKLAYARTIPGEDLEIVVEYDGALRGRIVDLAAGGEYTNFRLDGATGYSAEIRQQFTDLLLDIRRKCCRNRYFRSEQARRIGDFILDTYGSEPEFLWPNIPSYAAFRRKDGGKWFAFIGRVPLFKLDPSFASHEEVEVLNVKADGVDGLLAQKGYFPAFHMNKKHWVSILLDGGLADAEIRGRIADSYESLKGGKERGTLRLGARGRADEALPR